MIIKIFFTGFKEGNANILYTFSSSKPLYFGHSLEIMNIKKLNF